MLSRNNIFDRNNNTNNGYSSTNNYSSGTVGGYSRQVPACGSNRLDYKYDNLSPGTADLISLWKQCQPTSICCRLETFHLNPVQLRIEDYYLIRTNKLRSYQMDKVKTVIKNQSFNEELIKIESHKLPQVSNERPLDFEAFKRAIRGDSNLSYSRGSGNASNNIFSSNSASSNNVFSNNNQTNMNTNIFMNSSNRNNNTANIFGNSSNSSSGNGTQQSNNIFGVGSSNTGASSTFQNNIFSNKTSNTGANIFGANSSGNNTGSGNIFTSNQGNQGANNNFNNSNQGPANQGGTSNIFNNILNNSNNNNIFTNRSNNQPGSNSNNNLFNNSASGSNNLFSNQQNNNPDLNMFMSTVQNYLQMTQQYISELHRHKQTSENKDQEYENYQENYQQPPPKHKNKVDAFDFHNINLTELANWDTIGPREELVFMAPHLNKWKTGRQPTRIVEDETQMNHSWLGLPVHSRIIKEQPGLHNQSIQMHSRMINPGQSIRNPTVRETYNYESSMIYSRCGRKHHELHIERDCKVQFRLEINWIDAFKNNGHRSQFTSKEIEGSLEIQSLDLETEQGTKRFIKEVAADQNLGIRMDAALKIDRKRSMVDLNRSQASIVGKVQQKLVNLQGDYQVFYSRVRQGFISDFTISNAYGTIAWNDPIPYHCLDFKRGYDFSIENNEIDCKLPSLQSSCRVKFCQAPKSILKMIQEKGLKAARKQLQKKINEKGEGIKLGELWENGQWCIIFKNGFLF